MRFLLCKFACCTTVATVLTALHAQSPAPPSVSVPQTATVGVAQPILSLNNLHFLEGTWSAMSRDGKQALGAYTFVRELNGTVLARHSVVDAGCDPVTQTACGRQDLFYVFQDSPGATLQAISFDSEGHVVHYAVTQTAEASTSTLGRRDFVVFDSDPAQFGPRVRLRYERTIDTATGKDALSGAFEMLQPNGTFRAVQQWYGIRQ